MKKLAAGFFALALLVFFFQNCGKAGFENQELTNDLSSTANVDPKLAALPFPYEISVNQIAHMSCPMNSNGQATNTPFFSWKVGAFDNPSDVPTSILNIRPAGLRLSDKFMTEWKKTSAVFSPTFQESKFKEALMGLPSIANTQLQVSFRKPNTPRTTLMTLPNGADSPTVNFLPVVTTDAVISNFIKDAAGVYNLFPAAVDFASRSLEASLIVPSVYGAYDVGLRANYDSSFLTLGFQKPSTTANASTELSAPSTDDRYAYGKGYRIHFGVANPHTGTTSYPSSDSLAVVEEYDLETGNRTAGVGWDCSYKFKIVQNADRYKPVYRANHFAMINNQCPTQAVTVDYCPSATNSNFGIDARYFPNALCPGNVAPIKNTPHCDEQYSPACPQEPYAYDAKNPNPISQDDGVFHPLHPERPAILHALRRFLPANQWDINTSRRCIVPKADDNSCYQTQHIVYDETFFPAATANPDLGRFVGCGVAGQYPCAAYLTLCIRR